MWLDPLDYKTPIGEQLVPLQVKTYLPESFLCKNRCSCVIPVAVKDSFFHSLLYLLYRDYQAGDWRKKSKMVTELKQALADRKRYFAAGIPGIQLVSDILCITIAIIDEGEKGEKGEILRYGEHTSEIYMYRDILGVFSPVIINGQKIKSS